MNISGVQGIGSYRTELGRSSRIRQLTETMIAILIKSVYNEPSIQKINAVRQIILRFYGFVHKVKEPLSGNQNIALWSVT